MNQLCQQDLKARIELSNEVWNGAFPQYTQSMQDGHARFAAVNPQPDDFTASIENYGARVAEMGTILKNVYGSEASRRLTVVIGVFSNITSQFIVDHTLIDTDYTSLSPNNRRPIDVADEITINGYFGFFDDVKNPPPSTPDPLTVPRYLDPVNAGNTPQALDFAVQDTRNSIATTDRDVFQFWRQQANIFHKSLSVYEGGSHFTPNFIQIATLAGAQDPAFQNFLQVANYEPRMAATYQNLMSEWTQTGGGGLFSLYTDVSTPGIFGDFGHLRFLGDVNDRNTFVVNFSATTAGSAFDPGRNPDAFKQGLRLIGTAGTDNLVGTKKRDLIVAGDGADTIFPGGGDDGVNCGNGQDTVLFRGLQSATTFTRTGAFVTASGPDGRDQLFACETARFPDDGNKTTTLP